MSTAAAGPPPDASARAVVAGLPGDRPPGPSGARATGVFGRLFAALHWLEDAILVGVLGTMILLGAAQILLRNLLGEGIAWGDPLLRVLVLWAALVGAMVAARSDAHIRIDVLHQYLPARAKPWVDVLLRLATAAISLTMAWVSARFVADEREYGMIAFATVPAWVCELIIPIAFAVLGLRYLLLALRPPALHAPHPPASTTA